MVAINKVKLTESFFYFVEVKYQSHASGNISTFLQWAVLYLLLCSLIYIYMNKGKGILRKMIKDHLLTHSLKTVEMWKITVA